MTSKKTSPAAALLREALGDRVVLAGEPDYDAARTPWNLAIDQRPIAVVHPESPQEVADVAHAWAEWTRSAPESCSTSLRVMHLPPLPELPPFLSGRDLVVVDGAILETDETAAELPAPLRALGPEMDTFARMPAAELVAVHMDPPEPSPALSAGAMLSHLSRDAVDTLLRASAAPGLFFAELRHVGGAAARSPEGAGAVGAVAGDYLAAGIAIVPEPAMAEMAHAAVHGVVDAMRPWHAPSLALTFLDGGVDRSLGFGQSLARLRALKA